MALDKEVRVESGRRRVRTKGGVDVSGQPFTLSAQPVAFKFFLQELNHGCAV